MWRSYFKNNALPLWQLAIPLVLTGLSQALVPFFETLFLARLGADSLAAGAIVSWLFGTLAVIAFGTLGAINVLVSHRHGANDNQGIAEVAQAGLWLALVLALPTVILFWNIPPILLYFGQSPVITSLAQQYLHALAFALLPDLIFIALLEVLAGLGRGRLILVFILIQVILTISLSFVLIFGKWGFPALKIAGAGWGITASSYLMVISSAAYVALNSDYRHYFRLSLRISRSLFLLLRELLSIGLPTGVMYCLELAFFLTLILIIGATGGSEWMAANQVALQYMGFWMSMIFAVAQAITVRMGHLLGAKDVHSAKRAAICGVATAGGGMVIIAILFWCCPLIFIAVDFNPHHAETAAVVVMIIALFKVSSLFQIVEAIRIAWFGALRSLKDTRFPLFSTLIGFWLIPLPIGYALFHYTSIGVVGFWWGMVCGALISGSLLAYRFRYKIKQAYRGLS